MRQVEEQHEEGQDRLGRPAKKATSVGKRIIEGLEEALAWSKGEEVPVRVTQVQVPQIDVADLRRRMGLSQTQFALKFGFRPLHSAIGNKGAFALTPLHGCCWLRSRSNPKASRMFSETRDEGDRAGGLRHRVATPD